MAAETRARVGLISDTHGKLDPRVFDAFEGVDAIVHAGDVGTSQVLWDLESIAPIRAEVLGNTDFEIPGWQLEQQARATIAGKRFLVIHNIRHLGPIPEGVDIVVHGHTHVPDIEYVDDVFVVNPGPARRPMKDQPRTVALLEIEGSDVTVEIVPLDRFGPKR